MSMFRVMIGATRVTRRFVLLGSLIAALTVGVATATAGNGSSGKAEACQNGGWQNLARTDATGFNNQDECVAYGAHGGRLGLKAPGTPVSPTPVTEPTFNYDSNTCSVTVPFTQGLDTRLYGVNGFSQDVPITHDVTVTAGLDGTAGTAAQFWIGYTAQPGYVDANPGAGTSHIDFYNGDLIPDC